MEHLFRSVIVQWCYVGLLKGARFGAFLGFVLPLFALYLINSYDNLLYCVLIVSFLGGLFGFLSRRSKNIIIGVAVGSALTYLASAFTSFDSFASVDRSHLVAYFLTAASLGCQFGGFLGFIIGPSEQYPRLPVFLKFLGVILHVWSSVALAAGIIGTATFFSFVFPLFLGVSNVGGASGSILFLLPIFLPIAIFISYWNINHLEGKSTIISHQIPSGNAFGQAPQFGKLIIYFMPMVIISGLTQIVGEAFDERFFVREGFSPEIATILFGSSVQVLLEEKRFSVKSVSLIIASVASGFLLGFLREPIIDSLNRL